MSSLKFTRPAHWDIIETHLTEGRGERFAFALTRQLANSPRGPVLDVVGVELISDDEVDSDSSGWSIAETALDRVHNLAATTGCGLVEFHNHRFGPPGFSRTDEEGLVPMADYVTGLLLDQPYGAGVYADGRVHVEYWLPTSAGLVRGGFDSVLVLGDHLRLLNATAAGYVGRFVRQVGYLGESGSATLAKLRVAVVGAGGTGSHAALALSYLGVGEVLVLDDDQVEESNLNRLVTAGIADLGAPKNLVARRRIREVDPALSVSALPGIQPTWISGELDDVDVIIGCVDHDGPRDRLNQLAVETATPYIDVATGIDLTTSPPTVGGRVMLVRPDGPCLQCLGELDPAEVGQWVKSPEQAALDRAHGYGTPEVNPAVVHLNGIALHAAIAELVAWVSGHRPPAQYLDVDLSGALARSDAPPGCRVTPRRPSGRAEGCIACSHR
jgi:molybdopterin/thiamine biosynthesis adenylyltransferase